MTDNAPADAADLRAKLDHAYASLHAADQCIQQVVRLAWAIIENTDEGRGWPHQSVLWRDQAEKFRRMYSDVPKDSQWPPQWPVGGSA